MGVLVSTPERCRFGELVTADLERDLGRTWGPGDLRRRGDVETWRPGGPRRTYNQPVDMASSSSRARRVTTSRDLHLSDEQAKVEAQSAATDLVRRASSGDSDALERLLVDAQKVAWRFSMTVCGHPEDAEDAMQEALVRTYRHVPQIRDPDAFRPWLYRTVQKRLSHVAAPACRRTQDDAVARRPAAVAELSRRRLMHRRPCQRPKTPSRTRGCDAASNARWASCRPCFGRSCFCATWKDCRHERRPRRWGSPKTT